MTVILARAVKHSLPSMRNPELWQAERLRQRNARQGRLQAGQNNPDAQA